MRKKLANAIGICFMIISMVFLVKKILSYDLSISYIGNQFGMKVFLAVIVSYASVYFFISLSWSLYIHKFTDKKSSIYEEIYVFQKSNLMKYIPGNIWQYVGRNEIALISGLPHKQVVYATIFDIATMAFTAFFLSLLFMHKIIFYYIIWGFHNFMFLGVLGIFLILLILVWSAVYLLKKHITSKRILGMIQTILKSVCIYTVFFLVSSFLFLFLFQSVQDKHLYTMQEYIQFLGSYITSWLAGYVVPGAPGGVGIRESVMCILTKGLFEQKDILATLIVFRIITTLGEIISFLSSFLLLRMKKMKYKK